MYSIGELSRITQVTIKSIRYYQELNLLEPVKIDPLTNYRYYNEESIDRLSGIKILKELGFTLTEIKSILDQCRDESDLSLYISNKLEEVRARVKELKVLESKLKSYQSGVGYKNENLTDGVKEVYINIPNYAYLKIDGKYSDVGKGFNTLYKEAGRYVKGALYAFYQDLEYREKDPDFYAVIELRKGIKGKSFKIGSLSERKAVMTIYKGSYGGQGRAYKKLFNYCSEKGYKIDLPIIEHYIKGPGFIFKGNPENYITECIVLVKDEKEQTDLSN